MIVKGDDDDAAASSSGGRGQQFGTSRGHETNFFSENDQEPTNMLRRSIWDDSDDDDDSSSDMSDYYDTESSDVGSSDLEEKTMGRETGMLRWQESETSDIPSNIACCRDCKHHALRKKCPPRSNTKESAIKVASSPATNKLIWSFDSPPETYLVTTILRPRGYNVAFQPAASTPRFSVSSEARMKGYTMELTTAVRTGDLGALKSLSEQGTSMSACNKFGESILHLAARNPGGRSVFKFMLESSNDLYIRDDQGKTLLHDACWSNEPRFDVVTEVLRRDPWFFLYTDNRGHSAFSYIKEGHRQIWQRYLEKAKDYFWPEQETRIANEGKTTEAAATHGEGSSASSHNTILGGSKSDISGHQLSAPEERAPIGSPRKCQKIDHVEPSNP